VNLSSKESVRPTPLRVAVSSQKNLGQFEGLLLKKKKKLLDIKRIQDIYGRYNSKLEHEDREYRRFIQRRNDRSKKLQLKNFRVHNLNEDVFY
jgi:hypothetical protein